MLDGQGDEYMKLMKLKQICLHGEKDNIYNRNQANYSSVKAYKSFCIKAKLEVTEYFEDEGFLNTFCACDFEVGFRRIYNESRSLEI